jgi:hypothetical protein
MPDTLPILFVAWENEFKVINAKSAKRDNKFFMMHLVGCHLAALR